MQTMYSLLAMPAWFTENAKWFAIGAAVLIVILALVAGFSMGWGPLTWAGACALFVVLELHFHDKNPILKIGAVEKLAPGVRDLVSTLSIAVVCIIAALAVFGIISMIVGPHGDPEDEDEKDSDLDEGEKGRVVLKRRGGKRIFAASPVLSVLVTIVNAAVLALAMESLALVVVSLTPLKTGALKNVFENTLVANNWKYIHSYAFDFLIIGVLAAFAHAGFKRGMLRGGLIVTIAFIAAIIVSFWLPFSKFAGEGAAFAFIGKGSDYFGDLIAKALPEQVSVVLGKVACGLVSCVALCIAVALVGLILRLIVSGVKRFFVFRLVDGVLSMAVMFAVGAFFCVLIMALLYILGHFEVFDASQLFGENASLSKGIFAAFDEYLKPWLEKLSESIPKG